MMQMRSSALTGERMESLPHRIQMCKQNAGDVYSPWCNGDETSPVAAVVGGWQLCPYWRMAPLRTKAPLCQKRRDNGIATDQTGARIFPVSSLTSVSLNSRWMRFHGWLQALIARRFICNMSRSHAGLWLFIFLLKTHTLSLICLIKM